MNGLVIYAKAIETGGLARTSMAIEVPDVWVTEVLVEKLQTLVFFDRFVIR